MKKSPSPRDLLSPRSLVLAGLVAAVYSAVTLLFAPLSYGPVQVRISEALTLLPFILPEAVPGLFVGCVLANLAGGFGILDVVLGSAATLAAAMITARMPNAWLASVPPVMVNMLVVGGYLAYLTDSPFLYCSLYVGLGQVVSCVFLGVPLVLFLSGKMKKAGSPPPGS